MNKKAWMGIGISLLVCVLLVIVPLKLHGDSEFGGADGIAEEMITQIDPEYEPWFESIITLPGSETETLLFCLQAVIGALIIGYGFGYFAARKKFSKDQEI